MTVDLTEANPMSARGMRLLQQRYAHLAGGPVDPDVPHAELVGEHPGQNPHLRRTIVAIAEYITGLDDYPEPWDMFAAIVPWQTREHVEEYASALLREVTNRAAHCASDFDVEVAVDYLTGAR